MTVVRKLGHFLFRNELGQDVSEYCLLTALIALIGLGIFWHVSGGLQGMWNSVNSSLAAGNSTVSSTPTSGVAASH